MARNTVTDAFPVRHATLGAAAPDFAAERDEKLGGDAASSLGLRRRFPGSFHKPHGFGASCTIVHTNITRDGGPNKAPDY
jgi:hypothetical protein